MVEQMDRRIAMLREMNLYPLWVRREQPVAMQEEAHVVAPETAVVPEAEVVSVAAVVAVAPDVAVSQEVATQVADTSSETVVHEAEATEQTPAADLFAARSEPDAQFVDLSLSVQERKDSLLEFQLKHAGGVLANIAWPELKLAAHDCHLCALRAGCTQPVFGVGDEQADWLFIGEAPGEEEDAQNEPFVGEAGRLLDNMLMSIKLRRSENVYIANIIKCRPPENSHPHNDQIALCLPYVKRQIALIQPKLIVALGKTAATALLGSDSTLGSLRGELHDYEGIPLIATYHPAYLLRKPTEKARAWEDLCLAVDTMEGLGGS